VAKPFSPKAKILKIMTRREFIDYCLTFSVSFEDYPFDEEQLIQTMVRGLLYAIVRIKKALLISTSGTASCVSI
jgi:hypothetical protein